MPYSGPNDPKLPDNIKDLPEGDRETWVNTWNGVFADCIDDGGEHDDCETKAFAVAGASVFEDRAQRSIYAIRSDDWPAGQLCPYEDCAHDLAIPVEGWYLCGHCNRAFYARETDSDYEDYFCYRVGEWEGEPPEAPPIAEDLGSSWASPDEEVTIMEGDDRRLLTKIAMLVKDFVSTKSRNIKDVESWDGSASSYDSIDDYCAACLIDVNAAAGRDEKAQSHCMLPVREQGDGPDTYVRQAVHVAAGRFGQIQKPDDVSEESWDRAVKAAADKLISAHVQMDETAPASVYEVAGRPIPEEARAVAVADMWEHVYSSLEGPDGWPTGWPLDIFMDDDGSQLFLVVSEDGKLMRVNINIVDGELSFGEKIPVLHQFPPKAEDRAVTITRTDDGKMRVTAVVCTAVLNRVGEIDSTVLFDSFIRYAEETGDFPYVNFSHQGEGSRLGQADFLARDGFVYMASYLLDDNEFGRATAETLEAEPDYWGHSIEFLSNAFEMVEVADGIKIPVHVSGVNPAISILGERRAASWFTASKVSRGVLRMNQKNKDELLRLFGGDEDKVDAFIAKVDGTNQRISDEDLVARGIKETKAAEEAEETTEIEEIEETEETETDVETEEEVETEETDSEESAEETESEESEDDEEETEESDRGVGRKFVIDESVIAVVVAGVLASETYQSTFGEISSQLTEIRVAFDAVADRLGEVEPELRREIKALNDRLKKLEMPLEEQQQEWVSELPNQGKDRMIFRPSVARATEENGEKSMADSAASTLDKWPGHK